METIKTERLAGWGEKAARSIPITGAVSGKKTAKRLQAAMRRVAELSRGEDASAWYADNGYLARREGSLALDAFRSARRLRRCPDGAAVVSLCQRLTDVGPITEERVEEFLTGARRSEPMPETEAALIGAALRMAIILSLAEGADNGRAAELFTSLRTLAQLDLTDALERSDPVDELMRRDEVYPLMDEGSRARYRETCQRLARAHGSSTLKEAQTALDRGLHAHLCPTIRRTGSSFIVPHVLLTLLISLSVGFASGLPWLFFLVLLPVSEIVESVMQSLFMRFTKPRRLPRLELRDGVPPEGRTICAVSALLAGDDDAPRLAHRLEDYALASRDCGGELLFALLADLPDSRSYPAPEGQERLNAAKTAIDELNRRYGGGFFLLTRDARWDPVNRLYSPRERKRGAIEALCRLAAGQQSELKCLCGDRSLLRARYILCLDSDTRLVPGAARQLIGAAMHPANTPVIKNRVVVSGHAVIHPRMSVELESAMATDFARMYAGQGGTDPYGTPTGELFSDLFGRGGFSGKGIVDAQAYLACLDGRFPEGRVLSHDALEGAYLRGAYLGDVELTDGAPTNAASWFRRLDRWTRGDWQNLPWLFRRGRDLSPADRWRLFDSLRRSLVAPVSLLAIILSFFFPAAGIAGGLALLCLGADAVHAAFAGLFLPARDAALRCRSGVMRGLGGALTRFCARIILLPWEGFTCILAIFKALWRMGVSQKNLLQWVTAAQAEGIRARSGAAIMTSLLGAALLFAAPGPTGKALGLVWFFAPGFAALTGRARSAKNDLTNADRDFLLDCAGHIWSYFAQNCTRQDHWLPPDNVQIQPPKGTARRTSPTNIGLAVASAVAAMELELITPDEAAVFTERILTTIESLPRWRGHLYNWYDTGTLAPLQPAYVSTVDSGNLCACLIAAGHALEAHGKTELARRVREFAEKIDLGALYDAKRRLFRIGLDPSRGEPSPGHYDLMASEARLTSFIACARGDVPLRHWQALSRAQLSLDGWRGLASWSGSMFEYLMPELFLPLVNGSMLWETGRFCLYAQRRRTAASNRPWGSSESGFFSLDAGMDYRYKAHGAGALALRRDMDTELVIAPYASFLALCVHPKAAVKNLRRLKRRGLWGVYGHYEALDLTPGRTGPNGEAVQSFMSHHLGMSLCAAANCLKGGVMRRYFMDEPACGAYRPLLAERVPLGGPILRRDRSPLTRPPETRGERPAFSREGAGYAPEAPAAFPLSNGVYSLTVGADGLCTAISGGLLMYRPDAFELTADGRLLTPSLRRNTFRPWRYAGGVLSFTTPYKKSVMSTSVAVASGECGELRRVSGGGGTRLTLRFEPVLAPPGDYRSHPAFWRLGLEVTQREGAILIRRLARGPLPEVWLCLAATTRLSLRDGAGWQMHGSVLAETLLPEGGCAALALCFGRSREDAFGGAKRILAGGAADMAGSMASLLGMGADGIEASFRLCGAIVSGRAGPGAPREELWKQGISGDLPIVLVNARNDLDEARRAVKRHALLTACGMRYDLVIDTGEDGEYLHPRRASLRKYLEKYGLSSFEGQTGGIRFAGGDTLSACALLPPGTPQRERLSLPGLRAENRRGREAPEVSWLPGGAVCFDTPPLPPRMWTNTLTNGDFGCIAADTGPEFLWLQNARECPLTPWRNDPLAGTGAELLELTRADGRKSMFADGVNRCRVIHGFGWTRWETDEGAVTAFVPEGRNARILMIEGGDGAYLAWRMPLAMCPERRDALFTTTSMEDDCLTARNPRCAIPGTALRALSNKPFEAFSGDMAACLTARFDGRTGPGLDPCFGAVLSGGGVTVIVCGTEPADSLRELTDPDRAAKELLRVRDGWRSRLSRVHVRTPDEDLNRLMNGWVAYQAFTSRILGRTSVYQSGGAYGFRDQLQDAVNLLLLSPDMARRQIRLCCERQFSEGDVLHWWHETSEGPRGVRTRCSDDLLWLPWALCEYVEKTGDTDICRDRLRWLEGAVLSPEERERYFAPSFGEAADSVLEHAERALSLVLQRGVGPHGLLRTGSGDWNDGMDRVGGESVWLTWFFSCVSDRFAALLLRLGAGGGKRWKSAAAHTAEAAEHAWDGGWYLRGWWEDGAPLGAAGSSACAIDSISQSWAAFCPAADRNRVKTALRAAADRLYDEAHGITKLFAPPFGDTGRDPGYIRSYGPGFRENGGQYTHGAMWLASALLREGQTEDGAKILLSCVPSRHPPAQYGAEPYVLAADISSNADHYGEANWTWYTGSAGWFFRVVLEDLLGIQLKDGRLIAAPRLPAGWEGFEADICGRKIVVEHGRTTIS